MKKGMLLILTFCLLGLFPGCASGHWDASKMEKSTVEDVENAYIDMAIKEKGIKSMTKELTLKITNLTSNQYIYGLDQVLEVNLDNVWYIVPPAEGIMTIEIAMILEPQSSREDIFNLTTYYKDLKPGKYRAVKKFYSDNGEVKAVAPFEIK